jgi:hypothetical protein
MIGAIKIVDHRRTFEFAWAVGKLIGLAIEIGSSKVMGNIFNKST